MCPRPPCSTQRHYTEASPEEREELDERVEIAAQSEAVTSEYSTEEKEVVTEHCAL